MHITDPIADMLTRIRNANSARHDTVDVPASNMKKSIAQILLDEGYIKAYQVIDDGTQGQGHHRPAPCQQARSPRLRRCRRTAPRAPRPRYCHRLHLQGRYDRQGCSRSSHRRRSPCIRVVRRV